MRIAIGSGKGGTGKTLISTNLFYLLKEQNYDVSLIDCDAEEPNDRLFFDTKLHFTKNVIQKVPVIDVNKCTFCGKCHEYCNYNAIFILPDVKIIKVIDDLCHGCGACIFACEFDAINEKDVILGEVNEFCLNKVNCFTEAKMKVGVYSPVNIIKESIKSRKGNDIIIHDAPPGTSCPFIHTVNPADYVILVTEPTPFGLSDLIQSIETLKTMDKSYGVIINRAGIGNREVYHYLEQKNIPLLAEIPFDKEIALAYSKGEIVVKHHAGLRRELSNVFNKINKEYGNSDYQR